MATPSFATVTELSDWLGEPITDEADIKRASVALAMASALVRNETRRQWLADDGNLVEPRPDQLGLVTTMAAARAYTNPDGIEDVSEGLDDYTTRERRKVQEAGVYLTASEIDLLAPLAGRTNRGISVLSTTRGDYGRHDCFPAVNGNWPCDEC